MRRVARLEQGPCNSRAAARFWFLLTCVFVQPASAFDWNDRNVFALADPNRPLPDWVWEIKWVAGTALRGHWKAFEPSKGKFNWEHLDSEIAKAAASGKVVTIRIWGGAQGTPDWVYEAGAQGYEWTVAAAAQPAFGQTFKAPLPWDPVWLREWISFNRGNFLSKDDLKNKILTFMEYFNETMAKPFKWTYQGKVLTA